MEHELLTNSRATTFRRCRREHFYRYEIQRGLVAEQEALIIGAAFAQATEAWRKTIARADKNAPAHMSREPALGLAMKVLQASFTEAEVRGAALDPYVAIKAEEMMRGYHHRWVEEDLAYGYASVEQLFSTPLVNPATNRRSKTYRQSGKMDATQWRSGRLYLVETKTTSKPLDVSSTYFQRLALDSQVSTYYSVGARTGLDFAGCIYDVARKPQLSPYRATPLELRKYTQGKPCKICLGNKMLTSPVDTPLVEQMFPCPDCDGSGWKEAPRLYANQRDEDETPEEFRDRVRSAIAEAPDEYYRRVEVARQDDELEDHQKDLWQIGREMHAAKKLGIHPKNPDACERYNRLCPYWAACTRTADIFDNGVYRDVEKHPELASGTTAAR